MICHLDNTQDGFCVIADRHKYIYHTGFQLYIGFAPTLVGFLAWNAGVRRLGASGAMVFYNMLPLYGALLGRLFLGESIGLVHLISGALIVGGGLWALRGRD